MEHRQRRFIAAAILVLSLLIGGYLIFLTPSETTIVTPTPLVMESTDSVSTPIQNSKENVRWYAVR